MVNVWYLGQSKWGYFYALVLFSVFIWRAVNMHYESSNAIDHAFASFVFRAEFTLYVLSCGMVLVCCFSPFLFKFFNNADELGAVLLIGICFAHAVRIALELVWFFVSIQFTPALLYWALLEAFVMYVTLD